MSNLPAVTTDDFALGLQRAMFKSDMITRMMQSNLLVAGVDYGVIPGVDKPSLFKPGAEKLMTTLRYRNEMIPVSVVERFDGDPLFHYRYECRIYEVETGAWIATGIGSCNSMEAKYRYRKAERTCPNCGKTAIIKGKAEFGGGFICFAKKGGCGAKFSDTDPAIVSQPLGDVVNPDPFSLINTIDKMAQKRALIAAVLIATNASQRFTQDVEDMPGFGYSEMVIEVPEPAKVEEKPDARTIARIWWNNTKTNYPGLSDADKLAALGVEKLLDFDWLVPHAVEAADEKLDAYVVDNTQGANDPEPPPEKPASEPENVPPELQGAPGLKASPFSPPAAARAIESAFTSFWQQNIVKGKRANATKPRANEGFTVDRMPALFGAGYRTERDWNNPQFVVEALAKIDEHIKAKLAEAAHPGAVFSKPKTAEKADGVRA